MIDNLRSKTLKILILISAIPCFFISKFLHFALSKSTKTFDYIFIKPDNLGDVLLFIQSLNQCDLKGSSILLIVRCEFVEVVQSLRPDLNVISLNYFSDTSSIKLFLKSIKAVSNYRTNKLLIPVKSRYFFHTDLVAMFINSHYSMTILNDGLNNKSKILRLLQYLIYSKVIRVDQLSEKVNIDILLGYFFRTLEPKDNGSRPSYNSKGRRLIVFSPFTSDNRRDLARDDICRILNTTSDRNFKIIIIGAPDDKDKYDPVYLNHANVSWQVGQTSLSELPHLMNSASGLISAETGTVQLAGLIGLPTLVLAGGGHFGRFVGHHADVQFDRTVSYAKDTSCFGCNWKCTKSNGKYNQMTYPCLLNLDYKKKLEEFLLKVQ